MTDDGGGDVAKRYAVLLDYLAHGRPDGAQYNQTPIAYAVGEREFRLYEVEFVEDGAASIGDRVVIAPEDARDQVDLFREIEIGELSNTATSELEYVVEEIIDRETERFLEFYNDAQPVSLRLHQLDLLPGVGETIRNGVIDARKRGPFDSFDDLEQRVSGLHDPKGVIVDRIDEELRDEDVKYRLFVRPER